MNEHCHDDSIAAPGAALPSGGAPQMSAPPPLCRMCGEVIGVYEPLISLRDGLALETSRAAEPDGPLCELYHRDCWSLLVDGTENPVGHPAASETTGADGPQ